MTIGDSSHDLTLVDVLVVVVTYNSEDVLDGFFASLPGAFADVSSCRVVVSDNASADASIDMARRLWPEALIVSSPVNRGYAAAINAAVANGGPSRSVLILNDDIRLGLGSVRRLLDALEGEPDIGITVPRLLDGDGQLVKSLRREPTPMRVLGEAVLGGDRSGRWAALGSVVQDPSVYAVPHDVTWASGCAWLVSRSCWDTVGEWDESLFLYSEDVDYALRARRRDTNAVCAQRERRPPGGTRPPRPSIVVDVSLESLPPVRTSTWSGRLSGVSRCAPRQRDPASPCRTRGPQGRSLGFDI